MAKTALEEIRRDWHEHGEAFKARLCWNHPGNVRNAFPKSFVSPFSDFKLLEVLATSKPLGILQTYCTNINTKTYLKFLQFLTRTFC